MSMSTRIVQKSFSETAASELIQNTSNNYIIRELADKIRNTNLLPDNTEIRFSRGFNRVFVRFSEEGKLKYLLEKTLWSRKEGYSLDYSEELFTPDSKYVWLSHHSNCLGTFKDVATTIVIAGATIGGIYSCFYSDGAE